MNIAYKQMYALVFSLAIIAPVCGMENNIVGIDPQMMTEITEAVVNSAVWYRKPAVQAAAAITTAAAGYALAARMGRVAVPAFVVTLCTLVLGSKKVQASEDAQNVQNNDDVIEPTAVSVESTALAQNVEDLVTFNSVTKELVDKYNMAVTTLKNTTLDQYKDAAAQITDEDYQHMNENSLR